MAIKIGPYVLMHPTEGHVWINRTTGSDAEGGRFAVEDVVELLDKLWEEGY